MPASLSRQGKGNMVGKFTELFDNDWKRTRSNVRARTADDKSYDISYSWDARSDNPKEFSKMEATDIPVQFSKPVTLSGSQIVELEPQSGQFLNPSIPNREQAKIPLTAEQHDLDMSHDLRGTIPICQSAFAQGKTVTIEKRPVFNNMDLQPPTFQLESKPDYMIRAGPNADEVLLNPYQRRQIIEFQKREKEANAFIRKASNGRGATKKIVGGPLFKRGVLMVDAAENPDSEMYGERARKEIAAKEYKAQIHLERRSQLATKTSSIATNGNLINPDSVAPRVKTNAPYQTKGGKFHDFSFEETHNRLFCRQERAGGATRTQKIRDCEMAGKQYNIVTLTTVEHWPSRSFDRLQNKTLQHPSQVSMESSRNMQGSTRPY